MPPHRETTENQVEFYDAWNEQYRAGRYEEIEHEIKLRADWVLREVASRGLSTERILEVGCGTGWLTERLCELGSVTAIDLSPRAIAIAESRNTDASLIAGDIFAQALPSKSFDLVVCVETLFYVNDPQALIKEMHRLCKPRGHLALTTINEFVYDRRSDIGPPSAGQVRRWMSRAQTRRLIRGGFEVLAERTIEPCGDKGVLRFVNSPRLNGWLERAVRAGAIKRAKERLGLGGGVVFLARKRGTST